MPVGITANTIDEESAYLTVAEFKNAPTSLDINNLVSGGNQQAQDAELANIILRASSYMNEYLNQDLVAKKMIETQRVRVNNQGFISLHPNNNPVIALESFQYGPTPNNLQTLTDPSQCWFEAQQVIVPLSQMSATYSSAGPLSFGSYGARQQIFAKYTYVAGYVNTGIVTAVAAATSLTVSSGTGIIAGQTLRIYDGALSETVTVASTYTYGSSTVPLTSALVSSHVAGVAIGNLPTAIKQAAILLTTAFIRIRGDKSNTMNITTSAQTSNASTNNRFSSDIQLALDMVSLYRRVR